MGGKILAILLAAIAASMAVTTMNQTPKSGPETGSPKRKDKVVLTDAKGGTATVTTADLMQSNGIVHVTDAVSLPM